MDRSISALNEQIRVMLTDAMVRQLEDRPDLIEKVIPNYPPFGKRMLQDNGFYLAAYKRDNVELNTGGIAEIVPDGIVDRNGRLHPVDVIIYATGFNANKFLWPMRIVGKDGQVLSDIWGDEPRAYLGITVPGFPNLFCLYGPGTNLAHGGSIIFHTECQVRYVMDCLRFLIESGASAIDCKREVFRDFVDRLEQALAKMVWSHPGVNNWYKNARGAVVNTSPWRLIDYWNWTKSMSPNDYELELPATVGRSLKASPA
jgi:4-hydroxyacetophenone monooxygenase